MSRGFEFSPLDAPRGFFAAVSIIGRSLSRCTPDFSPLLFAPPSVGLSWGMVSLAGSQPSTSPSLLERCYASSPSIFPASADHSRTPTVSLPSRSRFFTVPTATERSSSRPFRVMPRPSPRRPAFASNSPAWKAEFPGTAPLALFCSVPPALLLPNQRTTLCKASFCLEFRRPAPPASFIFVNVQLPSRHVFSYSLPASFLIFFPLSKHSFRPGRSSTDIYVITPATQLVSTRLLHFVFALLKPHRAVPSPLTFP